MSNHPPHDWDCGVPWAVWRTRCRFCGLWAERVSTGTGEARHLTAPGWAVMLASPDVEIPECRGRWLYRTKPLADRAFQENDTAR